METEISALPDDALCNVLRRLPARSLAARSMGKPWHDIVDDRRLLLLSRVHGIFINYIDHYRPHLFACPTRRRTRVDGLLRFMPNDAKRDDWWCVLDHCNSLLLCHINWEKDLCVCNPATRC
ncbi:hypothetical protein QOZ80_5AG0390790 [Eleusine coracana subsp. coracana]|nr:hypothetical protein QOZ80_5AG0390790 [Eleusine coracana subsp. coracana]